MTIIIAVKFSKGVVVATDSRVTYEGMPLMRHEQTKILPLTKNIGVTSVGLTGVCDKVLNEMKGHVTIFNSLPFDDVVRRCEDIIWDFYQRYKERIEEEEEEIDWSFQLFSKDRIINIGPTGFSEEEPNYLCEGSGVLYAEYILRQRFKPNLSENDCKELAAYAVIQTSRIDPSVGGPIHIVVIDNSGLTEAKNEEIDEIIANITEPSLERTERIQALVNETIENRRWINDLFEHRFKRIIFEQNEAIIAEIQKDCRNENDFTSRIAALAILIDNMKIPQLKGKQSKKVVGSINQLEVFAGELLPNLNAECIETLRDIMTLRSKKMPIHKDDPKIIQVLLKWECKFPPKWSSLWIKALSRYGDSLAILKEALEKAVTKMD